MIAYFPRVVMLPGTIFTWRNPQRVGALMNNGILEIPRRVKRAAKELLGRPQWRPNVGAITPTNYEEQIYSSVVEVGDVCFDVGANVGDVAVFLARLVTPGGSVMAFEPVFRVYSMLCERVQADPNLKAPIISLPWGLSDQVEPRAISTPNGEHGLASLASSDVWKDVHQATIATQTCDFTTLDTILADERYPRPDFMKIDVEGAELLVLRGGSEAFKRGFRPLMLIELFAPWERAFGYGPWDVLELLADLGYEFLFACPEGLVRHEPSPSAPFPVAYERGYNIVAYVAEKHARRIERLGHLTGSGRRILSMRPAPVPNRIIDEPSRPA
jgi:FkbM family methyltransferase